MHIDGSHLDGSDDSAYALARTAITNGHGKLDSEESLDLYEQTLMLARQTTCDHCTVIAEVVPSGGARWFVDQHHEAHCPRHDDNTPGLSQHREATLYPPAWR